MKKRNIYRRRCRTCNEYFTAFNTRREFCPDTNCDDVWNNAKKWIMKQVDLFGAINQVELDELILARLCTGKTASVKRYMLEVHGFGFMGKRMEPLEAINRHYPEYHYKSFCVRELPRDHYIIIRQNDNDREFH